jgi:predicted neuraminidase
MVPSTDEGAEVASWFAGTAEGRNDRCESGGLAIETTGDKQAMRDGD